MTRVVVIALAALTMAACGGSKPKAADPPPPPTPVIDAAPAPSPTDAADTAASGTAAEAIAKMTEFSDKMCACKDKACAQTVVDEMDDWQGDNADRFEDVQPTDAEMREATTITERMATCAQKLVPSS